MAEKKANAPVKARAGAGKNKPGKAALKGGAKGAAKSGAGKAGGKGAAKSQAPKQKFFLELDTKQPKQRLLNQLKKFEPWGHRIDFSNGVTTKDLKRRTPFSENTVQKAFLAFKHIPTQGLKGKRILDVGCNSGYNSIYAATKHGMVPTGIDVSTRHIQVSTMLSKMAGIKAEFKKADAETYLEAEAFSVVFHFGTLYHLPNPLLSLQTTYNNLKPGGWVAIETQIYEGQDENECYFMHMHNNDHTNFWALSPQVMEKYMTFIGFKNIKEILRVTPKAMEVEGMHRTITIAQK